MGKPIAVNAIALNPRGADGINRYTGQLLDALWRTNVTWTVYAASPAVSDAVPGVGKLVARPDYAQSNFRGNLSRLLWYQIRLPGLLRAGEAAAFYSPVAEGMFAPPCPQVITLHDVLPLRFPETYPRLRYYFRHVLPRIIDASAAIITNSETTAADVRSHYSLGDKPVHVVYPGYDRDVFRPVRADATQAALTRYGLEQYVLSVGETRPYKNIRRLLEAFARIQLPDLQLAVVGSMNKMDADLQNYPHTLGISDRVRFLGYVPDGELAALYAGAKAFVFPSLYEGFGFPPLEAMACGCPVVASNVASIPEVCGENAVYVDPHSTGSIAAGIERVVTDDALAMSLSRRGLDRAQDFSYQRAATRVATILQDLTR